MGQAIVGQSIVIPWYLFDALDDDPNQRGVLFAATTERWRQQPNKLWEVLLVYVPTSLGVKLRPDSLKWFDIIFGLRAAVVVNHLVALRRAFTRVSSNPEQIEDMYVLASTHPRSHSNAP